MGRVFFCIRRIGVFFILLCCGILLLPIHVSAATFFVNTSSDDADDDLTDMVCNTSNDVCSLRAAIEQAAVNGESDYIYIKQNVQTIFLGKQLDIVDDDANDEWYDVVIRGRTHISGQSKHRVFSIAKNADVLLAKITIEKGKTIDKGAGILNKGNLTLSAVTVRGNTIQSKDDILVTQIRGAGIYNGVSGVLTLDHSDVGPRNYLNVSGKKIRAEGAGIYNAGKMTIKKSSIFYNYIFTRASHTSGDAYSSGAGIYLSGKNPVRIEQSSIYKNTSISQTTEDLAHVRAKGSAIYVSPWSHLDLVNSTLSNNKAVSKVSGISSFGFAHGAGVFVSAHAHVRMANVTMVDNSVSVSTETVPDTLAIGSAIYSIYTNDTSVEIKNSIIDNPGKNCNHALNSDGNNIAIDKSCVLNKIGDQQGVSPLLGPKEVYSGHAWIYPLLSQSPAVNAGNPEGCMDFDAVMLTKDQRNMLRPVGVCDIGAYEVQE